MIWSAEKGVTLCEAVRELRNAAWGGDNVEDGRSLLRLLSGPADRRAEKQTGSERGKHRCGHAAHGQEPRRGGEDGRRDTAQAPSLANLAGPAVAKTT